MTTSPFQIITASTCTLLDEFCSHLIDRLMELILAVMTINFNTLKPAIELYCELLPAAAEYKIRSEFTIWKHKWTSCEETT